MFHQKLLHKSQMSNLLEGKWNEESRSDLLLWQTFVNRPNTKGSHVNLLSLPTEQTIISTTNAAYVQQNATICQNQRQRSPAKVNGVHY